ncbi:MAG: hypothetical protein AAF673_01850 [Pseudomonadota bacterium]
MKNIFDKWKGGAEKHGGFANAMAKQMKDWGRDLDESLGKPSGVNSVIPEKRKDAENKLKDKIHKVTGGLAYPGRGDNAEESVSGEVIKEVVEERESVLEAHSSTGGVAYSGKSEGAALEPVSMIEEVVEEKESVLEVVSAIDIRAKNLSVALTKYLLRSSIDKEVSESILKLLDEESVSNSEVAIDVLTFGNKEVSAQVKAWVLQHIDSSASVKDLRKIAIEYYSDNTGETDVTLAIGTGGDTVSDLGEALFATEHPELSANVANYLLIGELGVGSDLE